MNAKCQSSNVKLIPKFKCQNDFCIEAFDIDLTFGFRHLGLFGMWKFPLLRFSKFATVLMAVVLLVSPLLALAQAPLLEGVCRGYDCTFCHLFVLLHKVIIFLIYTLAMPIAALLFAWAGILYITAAGNTGQIGRAKKIFGDVLLGLLVAISAALVIDLILRTFTNNDLKFWTDYDVSKCEAPITTSSPTTTTTATTTTTSPPPPPPPTTSLCPAGETVFYVDGDDVCSPEFQARLNPPEGSALHPEPRIGNCTLSSATLYASTINAEATDNGLNPVLVRAFIATESSFNKNAVSSSGAYGLMQLKPATARSTGLIQFVGKSNAEIAVLLQDPDLNIKAGTHHLASLLAKYNGDEKLAAAAYNGGAGANLASVNCPGARRWECPWDSNGCWPTGSGCTPNTGYKETRNYYPKIQANKICL